MRLPLLLLAVLALWPASMRAQLANVRLGSRVRIEVCEVPHAWGRSHVRTYIGELHNNDSTTIVLRSSSNHLDTIMVSQIQNAYWSAGWRSPTRSTVQGLLVGVAVGGLVGLGLDKIHKNTSGDGSGEAFESRELPVFGVLIGGFVGTLWGSASGGDQWRRTAFPINSGNAC